MLDFASICKYLFTYSRNEVCHMTYFSPVHIRDCCACNASPTIVRFGPCHWKSHIGHRPSRRHRLYLRYVLLEHPKVLVIHLKIFGPWGSISAYSKVVLSLKAHQTFKKLSSEALTSTFPAVSAQQQLLISSSWAGIFTVRLFASRSYTVINWANRYSQYYYQDTYRRYVNEHPLQFRFHLQRTCSSKYRNCRHTQSLATGAVSWLGQRNWWLHVRLMYRRWMSYTHYLTEGCE